MLADLPHAAQLANIQCENCHGPQGAASHSDGSPRISLASDICGVCHGEPLRHGRFQHWNLLLLHSDGSHGAHNPALAKTVLEASKNALMATPATEGGIGGAAGTGDGTGAVGCNSPYVYWTEIAAHNDGPDGSGWRSDVVALNLNTMPASVQFILHTAGGMPSTPAALPAAPRR